MRSKPALVSETTEIDVQFYDVDAMRIVWHGNYVKYLEEARCNLLRKFDYDYLDMEASGYLWPIVDMRLKYVKSAVFGRKIKVTAGVTEYESRLKIDYKVCDSETGDVLTKAYTIQVAVDIDTGEMQFESPAVLSEKLSPFINEIQPA